MSLLAPYGTGLTHMAIDFEREGLLKGTRGNARRARGLPGPGGDERASTEEDVDAAKRIAALRAAGVPDEGIREVSRVIGLALAQVAAASRALVAESARAEGGTEADVGHRLAQR